MDSSSRYHSNLILSNPIQLRSIMLRPEAIDRSLFLGIFRQQKQENALRTLPLGQADARR